MDLLQVIKNRLKITWDEQDDELNDIIVDGKIFIEDRVGEVDWNNNVSAVRLLKEYSRYSWNGSVAFFEENFKSDLINLQIKTAMEKRLSHD